MNLSAKGPQTVSTTAIFLSFTRYALYVEPLWVDSS